MYERLKEPIGRQGWKEVAVGNQPGGAADGKEELTILATTIQKEMEEKSRLWRAYNYFI